MSKNSEILLTITSEKELDIFISNLTDILLAVINNELNSPFLIATDLKCILLPHFLSDYYTIKITQFPGKWYCDDIIYSIHITKENAKKLYLLSRININSIIPYIKITVL